MKIIHRLSSLYIQHLSNLVLFSVRRARLVIAISLIVAVASLLYSNFYLPVNSEQESLVSHESEFFKREDTFSAAFPQHNNTIIILLSGDDAWKVGQAAKRLGDKLESHTDLFKNVFYPQGMEFFRQNGLLYLEEGDLIEFTDGLAQAQPAIASLAKDPNLRGLLELLDDGFTSKEKLPESFDRIVKQLNLVLEDFLNNRNVRDLWAEVFQNWGVNSGDEKRISQVIVVSPFLDYSDILSGKKAIQNVRDIAGSLNLDKKNISVTLTGREPLTFDELASVVFNVKIAAAISTLAIIIFLGLGIRSWRMIAIIMGVLFVGISWTFGWAAFSVGELNLISAAFVVLFLGISVDFSIHVALRYREEYQKNPNIEAAMLVVAEKAGPAISLCALATAIGFLSFVPTEFFGVRDLGIIAGGSMFFALLSSWTLLPALLVFLKPSDLESKQDISPNIVSKLSTNIYEWVRWRFRAISVVAILLGVLAFPTALKIGFDYSALAIKDPNSESVIGLRKLLSSGLFTSYTATILAKNRKEALETAKTFENLELVRRVDTHLAFVPKKQNKKLELIEEASFFMASVFSTSTNKTVLNNATIAQATKKLLRILVQKGKTKTGLTTEEKNLGKNLMELLRKKPEALVQLSQKLMGDFDERLELLETSLSAESFGFDELPKNVRRESETEDGQIKVSIYPKEDLTETAALIRFVKLMEKHHDAVGGRPAGEYEVGALMVRSFQTALVLGAISITLLLLISLRSITKTILVLVPIILTAIWTLAFCVWFDIAFNFVNILVLPLLLGLGVANGIHILSRTQQQDRLSDVMRSSTPVAVFLSNATTLASFGSVSVATHWGLQSMGITLSIAMILMMISALIILPAIIAWVLQGDNENLTA